MKQKLKQFATSQWFDLLGVVLVLTIAISAGYHLKWLNQLVDWGTWTVFVPFGWISVGNVAISMLSTRFTGKLSTLGNYLGILNAVLSGLIDYILGNKAAIITYPVTFLIYLGAIYWWGKSQDGKANTISKARLNWIVPVMIVGSFAFSYWTNYLGYQGNMNPLAYVTTVAFALSLVANGLNVLKLSTQWSFWLFYNFVQLAKAFIQGNFANVGKYIFYILNSLGALFIWRDSEG